MKAFSGILKGNNKNISFRKTKSLKSKKLATRRKEKDATPHNVHLIWLSVKSSQNSNTPYKMIYALWEV